MPPFSHDGGLVIQLAVAGIASLAAAIALLRAAPSNRSGRRALRFASGAFLLAAAAVLVSGSVFEQKRRASHDVLRAAIPVAEDARCVLAGEGTEFLERLRAELREHTRELGVATMLPRVVLVSGSRILDLSDARRPEDVLTAAERALDASGTAVAVLAR